MNRLLVFFCLLFFLIGCIESVSLKELDVESTPQHEESE